MSGQAEGRARAKGQGVKESCPASRKGFSAADVKTEATSSSSLGTTCFVGSLQSKIQTIRDKREFTFM